MEKRINEENKIRIAEEISKQLQKLRSLDNGDLIMKGGVDDDDDSGFKPTEPGKKKPPAKKAKEDKKLNHEVEKFFKEIKTESPTIPKPLSHLLGPQEGNVEESIERVPPEHQKTVSVPLEITELEEADDKERKEEKKKFVLLSKLIAKEKEEEKEEEKKKFVPLSKLIAKVVKALGSKYYKPSTQSSISTSEQLASSLNKSNMSDDDKLLSELLDIILNIAANEPFPIPIERKSTSKLVGEALSKLSDVFKAVEPMKAETNNYVPVELKYNDTDKEDEMKKVISPYYEDDKKQLVYTNTTIV
jgi:hypothetical protein